MERDQAKTIISETLDQDVNGVDMERLISLRQDIALQSISVEMVGIYKTLLDALDTEISCRKEDESGKTHAARIHPKTPADVVVAGGEGDKPGQIRHGAHRSASTKWRVTGR
ncbi:MAG: hypothetical protein ACYC27_09685 [Armatimonadota bacterium]